MNKTTWAVLLLLCSLVVPTISDGAEAQIVQTRAQYEVSLRHSDYLVQITVVDDRSGEFWTGCTRTGLLLGALADESGQARGIDAHDSATATALSNRFRTFHFSNPRALYNLTTVIDPSALSGTVRRACIEMKKTGCMREQDLTGQFVPC